MNIYFHKTIWNNKFICGGRPAPFEQLAQNEGVLAIDDSNPANKEMIEGLEKAAREHRGGVTKITEEEYQKKKQLQPYDPSANASRRHSQLLKIAASAQQKRPPKPPQNANPVADVKPKIGAEALSDAPRNTQGLRLDGPTRQEWIDQGYDLKNYPPAGFAERDTPAKNDPVVKRFYKPRTEKLQKETAK